MPFCNKCGSQLASDSKFCTYCGAPVGQPTQQKAQQTYGSDYGNYYDPEIRPKYEPPRYGGASAGNAQRKDFPLGWHKFMTRFALWLSALMFLATSGLYFSGACYENEGVSADLVYAFYGTGLKVLDILYGLACCGLAGMTVWVCLSLMKFKVNAPQKLYLLCLMSLAVSLVYLLLVRVVTGISVEASLIVSPILGSIVGLIINYQYYKKRASLFVN